MTGPYGYNKITEDLRKFSQMEEEAEREHRSESESESESESGSDSEDERCEKS